MQNETRVGRDQRPPDPFLSYLLGSGTKIYLACPLLRLLPLHSTPVQPTVSPLYEDNKAWATFYIPGIAG